MEVRWVDDVRGRDAWHTIFTIKGGVPLYKVDDRMESWIDTASFTSLRFVQETNEGRRHRTKRIELYPERGVYVEAEWDPSDPAGEMDFIAGVRARHGFPTVAVGHAWLDREFAMVRELEGFRILRRLEPAAR